MEGIKFAITADNQQFINAMDGVRNSVRNTMQDVERSGQSVEDMLGRLRQAAALSFAGFSGAEFIKQVANVRGQFQQLEVAFTTMLGSEERANTLMNQLVKTAATTPFDLKGVADGAKSLMAYGTAAEDVNEMIVRLGDIAAGMSIDLKDLVYLYGTTMVQGRMFTQDLRQFQGRGIPIAEELAKVLNTTKDAIPDLVTAGKVTGDVLQQAIVNMTNAGGKFGGLMAAQSKTIVGQISNIEDAFDMMFNDIGKQSEGVINASLDSVSFLIEHWQQVGAAILAVVETAGIYKATLATMSAMNTAATNIGYDAEIAALQSLLPLKEQEAASDLQNAVSSGQLTEQKAMEIAALREEAAAHVANLQAIAAEDAAKAESAAQSLLLAQNRDAEAQRDLDYYQEQYDKIVELGDGFAIEKAEEELNTAASIKNTTAKEVQTAAEAQQAAATKASASSKAAETAQTNLNTASEVGNTAATGVLTQAKLALKRAVDAVNASFLASPIFWIAAAIAGVTFAVYKLVTAESAEEAAVRSANEALDEQNKKLQDRKANIENLIRIVQDENATDLQRYQAYQKLAAIFPELTEKYTQQQLAAMKLDDVQKMLNEDADTQKQQELKKTIDDLTESIEKQRKQLESLASQPSATAGAATQMNMLSSSIKKSELELDKYKEAYYGMLADIENMKKEGRPIEVKLEEAEENAKLRDDIYGFYEKAILYTEQLQNASSDINYTDAQNRFEEFVSDLKDEVEGLRKDVEGKPADFKLQLEYQEKQKVLDDILTMKNDWSRSGVTTIPLYFQMHYIDAEQAKNEANKTFNYLTGQMEERKVDTKTPAQWVAGTLKAWKTAEKALSDFKNSADKMTDEDYKKKLKDLTDDATAKKKAYQDAGGDVSGKKGGGKKDNTKNEVARQRAAAIQEERRYQEELDKIRREAEEARIDATIAAIANEGVRERAEQDEQHKRNLREIEQQANEMRKAIYEHNKKVWENSHKDGVYEVDTKEGKAGWDDIRLSDDQQQLITSQLAKENAEYNRLVQQRYDAEAEAMRSFLKEYGTIEQQKLAITQEYEEKIRKASSPTEQARLTLERDQELRDVQSEDFSDLVDWAGVFSDLQGHTKEYLEGLRGQLQAILDAGELPVDQMATVQEKLREVNDAISQQTELFKFVGDRQREHNRLLQQSADAQDLLNMRKGEEVVASMAVFAATEKIKAALEEAEKNTDVPFDDSLLQQFDATSDEYKHMSELLKVLHVGEANLAKARKETDKATRSAKNAEDAARRSSAQGVADWFTDAQQFIAQKGLDQLPELFNSIGLGKVGEKMQKGLDGFNDAAGAATDFASGNYVGALVKGVSAIKNFGSALGIGKGNGAKVAETTERLTKSNELLADRIDDLKDAIGDSAGLKAIFAYKTALEAQEEINKNQMEILRSQMGYHEAHHSNEYYADDSVIRSYNAAAQKAFKAAGVDASTISGLSSIYNLTPEQLKAIKDFAPDLWKYLTEIGKYDKSEYWDAVVEQAGKVEELTEQINANLTQTSFSSMRDSFLNELTDMNSDAKDFAKSFEDMMFKAIVNSFVLDDEFDNWLNEFYTKWADKIKSGGMSKQDWENFNSEYMNVRDQKIAERDRWASAMGYSGKTPYEQNATSGGWQSMGQDTADELNGRFTALQMSGERISEGVLSAVALMTAMSAIHEESGRTLSEIRNLMVTNNSFLEDILGVNKKMRDEFNAKLDKISINTK